MAHGQKWVFGFQKVKEVRGQPSMQQGLNNYSGDLTLGT